MRQGQLVNWYLSEIEGDIDSVEMLAEKKVLVEKVIERLIHHVRCVVLVCVCMYSGTNVETKRVEKGVLFSEVSSFRNARKSGTWGGKRCPVLERYVHPQFRGVLIEVLRVVTVSCYVHCRTMFCCH